MRKTKTSYTKSRYRELLWMMIQKFQANCYLCHKPFSQDDLPARTVDLLTDHHVDGNHYNNDMSNRVLVHRLCHKSFHAKDNIQSEERKFWRQFK